jgi:hypothetical protein
MREINTLTREEACEFINAIDIGEFQISRFRYVKRRKAIELETITEWVTTDDNGKDVSIKLKDRWYFGQNFFNTDYSLDYSYGEIYFEFLLAKGFKENQFKTMPPI